MSQGHTLRAGERPFLGLYATAGKHRVSGSAWLRTEGEQERVSAVAPSGGDTH